MRQSYLKLRPFATWRPALLCVIALLAVPGRHWVSLIYMNWTSTAATLLALGVTCGAFGAHALKARLGAYEMGIWEKAVFYHFVHALGMLAVSLMPKIGALTAAAAAWTCVLLLAGIVLFSGSLYALALSGMRVLGAVTPLGGIAFIAAWLVLAVALIQTSRS